MNRVLKEWSERWQRSIFVNAQEGGRSVLKYVHTWKYKKETGTRDGLTWPENMRKGANQGNETQALLCNSVEESTLHRGENFCYYGTWGRWNWKTEEDGIDYRMTAWHQLLLQNDSRCLFVTTTPGLYNTGVWQYIPQSLKSSKFNISNSSLVYASPFTG